MTYISTSHLRIFYACKTNPPTRKYAQQQPLEPDIFKYSRFYDDLPESHTHIIVIVKFEQKIDKQGQVESNNFVITAYMK